MHESRTGCNGDALHTVVLLGLGLECVNEISAVSDSSGEDWEPANAEMILETSKQMGVSVHFV